MTKSLDQGDTPGTHVEVDLRLIREKKGVSIEKIHQQTKIPVEVLSQFEQGALTQEPQFNRVYLRAIVRTYAELLEIDRDLALASLEESFRGRYAGTLAVEYLDLPPERVPEPEIEPEPEPEDLGEAGNDIPAPGAEPLPPPSANIEHANRPVYEVDVRPPMNWSRIALIVIAVIALGLIIWIAVSRGTTDTETFPADDMTLTGPREPAPPPVEIGPTMNLLVIAEEAPLSPIRVRTDAGTLTPYWVEFGDSLMLSATDSIQLSGNLGGARVLVEGIEWPLAQLGTRSALSLTRAAVEARLGRAANAP